MCGYKIVQVGVQSLLESREEGVAYPVDLAAFDWDLWGTGSFYPGGRGCLGQFKGVFVEGLRDILVAGER